MAIKNSKFDYLKFITIVFLITNTFFFLMHVFYSVIFSVAQIRPLIYHNIISGIYYLFMFLLIRKKKFEIYTLISAIEIISYLTTATILVGFDSGFPLTLVGLCVLAFIAKYFFIDKKIILHPIIISSIFAIDYIFLFIYYKFNQPLFEINQTIKDTLFLTHSIVVFIFVSGFMFLLIRYILRLEQRITKESETDKLTQLGNRKALANYFNALDKQKSNYILAIFDIDDFKIINDKNSHLCGDFILHEVANIAKENCNEDYVTRWGGEEFIIISKIDDTLENTYKKLENLREKIDKYEFNFKNKIIHATITMGIATYVNNDTLETWIDRADKKLYVGKNSHKNKIIY